MHDVYSQDHILSLRREYEDLLAGNASSAGGKITRPWGYRTSHIKDFNAAWLEEHPKMVGYSTLPVDWSYARVPRWVLLL